MHRRDGQLIVSATDPVGFLECGHLSALDLAVANDKLDKPFFKDATLDSDFLRRVERAGEKHHLLPVSRLVGSRGPDMEVGIRLTDSEVAGRGQLGIWADPTDGNAADTGSRAVHLDGSAQADRCPAGADLPPEIRTPAWRTSER
jgi:hypothetical protein